jgi:hypothetical protein
VDLVRRYGLQDLILCYINSFVFGDSKRIKHSGVMKAGQLDLQTGATCGTSQDSGKIVDVNVVATA